METLAKPKTARPRGAVHREGSTLITAWVPRTLADRIAAAVEAADTDRSKFVRRAIRQELDRSAV